MSEGEDKGAVEPPAPEEQAKQEESPKTEDKKDELQEEEVKKSDDKLEIEAEEREKMIEDSGEKQEPKRVLGEEVEKKKKALEEAVLEGAKRRVPIGGIKIPGFLRPKSRDKPKEGEQGEPEEGLDLLEQEDQKKEKEEQEQPTLARLGLARLGLDKLKFSNPFSRLSKEGRRTEGGPESEEKEGEASGAKKPRLLNAVKLPLASVLPKLRPVSQNKEGEGGGPAGLASVETLGDADSQGRIDENNMENVRLENHEIDAEKAALEEEVESKWAAKDWRFYTKRFYEFRYPIIGLLILLLLLIILIVVAIASGPDMPLESPLIDGKYINAITSCGPVQGVSEKGVYMFRGIPYALPPIGYLRWSAPKPFTLSDCWNGTLKLHNATESCWAFSGPDGIAKGSENCLTLDIITPSVRYHSPMPVVVVLGEDTLTGGGRLEPSPRLASEKEVVFVIPRYRLGPLGFLAAQPLSGATYPYSSGNYGMHDLVAAFKWIRLNIVHFGGNNRTVTVLAHRAAATLVTAMTSSLKVEKLFDRVWLSSSGTVFPNKTLVEAEKSFKEYFTNIKCTEKPTIECLRRQEASDLMEAVPEEWRQSVGSKLPLTANESFFSWIVLDGHILRSLPEEIWSVKNTTIEVVLGTTLHSEWFSKENKGVDDSEWDEEKVIGELKSSVLGQEGVVDEVIKRYGSTLAGLQSVIADIRTICPLVNLHKDMTNSKLYLVTQPRGNMSDGLLDVESILGIYKGSSAPEKKFVSTIQRLFFDYAMEGISPKHPMFKLGQDTLPVREFDNCQFWADNNFTSYARVY